MIIMSSVVLLNLSTPKETQMSDLSLQEKVRWFLNQYPGLSLLLPSFVFILFVLKWWFCSSSNNKKNLPPSPPKLPIIGNLHQIGSLLHRSFHSLSEKYGPIMLLQLGTKKLLVVTSVEAAHEVLKTHDAAFCGRPDTGVARKIYYNLKSIAFAPYGEYWKQVRSISVLLFLNQKRVQSFRYVREEEVALMVSKIKSSCSSSSEICMDKMLKTLTYDIVSRITIGKRYSGEGGNKLAELLLVSTELLGAFNIGDFFPWLGWANHIIGFEAKVKKVKKELDECLENLIDEEESNRQKRGNSINAGEGHHQGKDDNQNLLQDLVEYQRTNSAGYALERDSLKAIIMDMILGGSDTYTLLEWAMALLVKHTNVMKKLQKEVKEVAGSKSFISEDDIDNLKYLKAVIKETFRFGHPGTMVPRASTKDVKLMGYDVAAGTEVLVNVWAIGRDPTLWEEPEEFRPERFLNNSIDVKGRSFELVPFGSGRRGCPGATFALIIAELALANLVCHFNFALPGGARAEDLDITEAPGAIIRRKTPLLLVPSLR